MINDIRPSRAYNYSAGPVRPDHGKPLANPSLTIQDLEPRRLVCLSSYRASGENAARPQSSCNSVLGNTYGVALLPASYIVSQTFKLRMHGKLHTVANQAYERWRKEYVSPLAQYPSSMVLAKACPPSSTHIPKRLGSWFRLQYQARRCIHTHSSCDMPYLPRKPRPDKHVSSLLSPRPVYPT